MSRDEARKVRGAALDASVKAKRAAMRIAALREELENARREYEAALNEESIARKIADDAESESVRQEAERGRTSNEAGGLRG